MPTALLGYHFSFTFYFVIALAVIAVGLLILLVRRRRRSCQASPVEPVAAQILDLNRFSVTQLVSFSFYLIAFLEFFSRYDPARTGIGDLLPIPVCKALPTYFPGLIIFSVICVNAIRYYLSFWLVELDDVFKKLHSTVLGTTARRIEWALRASGLICLYLLQLSLAQQRQKWLEGILLVFYACLVLWDIIIDRSIPRNDKAYDDLRKKIRYWLKVESFGLCVSLVYCILALSLVPGGRNDVPDQSTMIWLAAGISVLGTLFYGLAFMELGKHRRDYLKDGRFGAVFVFLVIICIIASRVIHVQVDAGQVPASTEVHSDTAKPTR